MSDQIINCEECGNIILVDDNTDNVFPCPICGVINVIVENALNGHVMLNSPPMKCHKNVVDGNVVDLRDLDKDVEDAIIVLMSRGWELKFQGK